MSAALPQGEEALVRSIDLTTAIGSSMFTFVLCVELLYLLFSTSAARRSLLFLINTFSFLLAAVYFILLANRATLMIQVLVGGDASRNVDLATHITVHTFLSLFAPLVAESTLTFKLIAFYPSWHASRIKRLAIIGPYVIILLVRLAASFVVLWATVKTDIEPAKKGVDLFDYTAYNEGQIVRLVDSCLQLAGSAYVSFLFLRRSFLYHRRTQLSVSSSFASNSTSPPVKRRLRFFVESVCMTFIPPVCLHVIIVTTLNYDTRRSESALTWAIAFNVAFSYAFSILATSWSTIRETRSSATTSKSSSSVRPVQRGVLTEMDEENVPSTTSLRSIAMKRSPLQGTVLGSIIGVSVHDDDEGDDDNMEIIESYQENSSQPDTRQRRRWR